MDTSTRVEKQDPLLERSLLLECKISFLGSKYQSPVLLVDDITPLKQHLNEMAASVEFNKCEMDIDPGFYRQLPSGKYAIYPREHPHIKYEGELNRATTYTCEAIVTIKLWARFNNLSWSIHLMLCRMKEQYHKLRVTSKFYD